jgi:hypothetical protein
MAAIIATDWETALGIGGVATPYSGADDKPLFEASETVFNVDDYPTSGGGTNEDIDHKAYTIQAIVMVPATSGGVTKLLDQSLAFATSAVSDSGTTTRSVFGWNHTTTPAATTTATTPSGPFFYDIADENGDVTRRVHQTKLTNQASIETYVAAEIGGWWS